MIVRIGTADDNDYVVSDKFASRYHALLGRDEKGDLFIEDLGSTNGTVVNGDRVIKKKITLSDAVILGEHYRLSISDAIRKGNDYSEDFFALKNVYDSYLKEKIRIQSSGQFKTRIYQSLPFAIIALVGLIIGFIGKENKFLLIGSLILGICVPTIGVYLGARQSAKIPEKLHNLANQFKIDYVCPKCGVFLGEIPWESLINKKHCHIGTCRAKWSKA